MKRIYSIALCLFAVLAVEAKNGLVLKSGDGSVLSKDAKVYVVFDYSKAKIAGKGISLEDYIDEKGYKFESKWEKAQSMSHRDFIKQFNKKSTGIKLNADSTGAEKYKMIIQIRSIDLGNTAKSLLPVGRQTDGGASLFGRLILNDRQGASICAFSFSDIQGNGTASIEVRLLYAYQALRSAILRYVKKSSPKKVEVEEDDDEEDDADEDEDEDDDD